MRTCAFLPLFAQYGGLCNSHVFNCPTNVVLNLIFSRAGMLSTISKTYGRLIIMQGAEAEPARLSGLLIADVRPRHRRSSPRKERRRVKSQMWEW